ncbi:hypothetical protein EJB05_26743, partial [Eragrostis curvula]
MGSLLKKLDELLLTEDCAPNIQQLREDVGSISSKLVKLSDLHDPPLTVCYWRKDARELSYDMEDCVDKFIHAKEDEKTKMDWINEITGFETRVEEVKERYDRFNLEFVLSNPNVTETVANFDPRIENEESKPVIPLGMEGPINEILGWLKPKEDDDSKLPLKVVSILGVEGVGKSTLAQELWRKLGGEFECQAFVQAAKKPDMRMILRSILSQVSRHEPPEVCQVPKLIHDIRKLLRNKRRNAQSSEAQYRFQRPKRQEYSHILGGIQHLLNLKEIAASIGADIGAKKSDRKAAESAFQDAISKHPYLVSFKVKWLDRVDRKYDSSQKQNWMQEIVVSNEQDILKKQHGVRKKDLSYDQPVVQRKMSIEDMMGHADKGVEQHETPAPEKPRPLLLLLVSLTAAITYQAGPNPPDGLWLDEVEGHLGGEPILLTPSPWRFKAFWYCNSVSLVTSFLSIIILLQKRVRLDKHVLENAMILDLLGLIGAYIAGSCLSISTSLHYAMALVGTVLMIHIGYVGLNHTDVFGDKTHKWFLIFATLTATITFGAAFFIENNESGWVLRYRTLICWNAVSFVLSIAVMLLLVCSNLYTLDFLSTALSVCMAAEVCSLLGAAEAGNVPSSKTHTYIVFVVAVVMSVAILDLLSRNRADMENDMAWDPTAQKDGSGKEWDVKYLMMLATIEAAVTCHVGLSAPDWGVAH